MPGLTWRACAAQVLVSQGLKDTQLRCAGGWVRDKLLGKDSHDIDIALNNLYGEEFANHVNEHLQATSQKPNKVHHPLPERQGSCGKLPRAGLDLAATQLPYSTHTVQVAVIKSNPDQSKHLQTARMKVVDLELDLVNLRSESYSDSRIPEVGIGTPEQDALRRDLTINSLFYNINTEQVRCGLRGWAGLPVSWPLVGCLQACSSCRSAGVPHTHPMHVLMPA